MESLLLALPGAFAGVGISWLAVRLLNTARPAVLLRYPPVSMDLRVLGFTFSLTLAAACYLASRPALSAAATRIYESLKSGHMTHSGGPGASRLRKVLLVAELAVSMVLLIGAGLLTRTFLNLAHTDLGFRTDHLLTFRVNPIWSARSGLLHVLQFRARPHTATARGAVRGVTYRYPVQRRRFLHQRANSGGGADPGAV